MIKLNSTMFQINKESEEFKTLESILTKIASDNKIDNVEEIRMLVSKDNGVIKFRIAEDKEEDKEEEKKEEACEEKCEEKEEKEEKKKEKEKD